MKRAVAALLAGAIAMPLSASPVRAAQRMSALAEPTAEDLYERGKKAYRLTRYAEAIKLWEQSYELSSNRLLLYNIALAWREQYSVSRNITDLEEAIRRLDAFLKEAQSDDELADAQARMKEFESAYADAKAQQDDAAKRAAVEQARRDAEEKKARKLRLAGVVTMGAGGALLVTGTAMGAVFAFKSAQIGTDLESEKDTVTTLLPAGASVTAKTCFNKPNAAHALEHNRLVAKNGGVENDASRAELAALPADCTGSSDLINALANIGQLRINGDRANTLTTVSFAVFGSLGLAAIIAGAVVYSQGRRNKKAATAHRWQLAPMLGNRSGYGLALSGRF